MSETNTKIKLTDLSFNMIPDGMVFSKGVIENSPNGIYMTDHRYGHKLCWVAKKGMDDDWAIYMTWEENGFDHCRTDGDKIIAKENIMKLVPCSDSIMRKYRF